jgi:hypothetical protein
LKSSTFAVHFKILINAFSEKSYLTVVFLEETLLN